MGESVKIINLAKRMVELSGLTIRDDQYIDGDIEIEITGLRPGEKLYEELLIGDNPEPTEHSRIMKAREDYIPLAELQNRLQDLGSAMNVSDLFAIRSIMTELVPGFTPNLDIVDWIFLEKGVKNNR
jgi:FlaA1/EpsC-like NDP-sugar epimerase